MAFPPAAVRIEREVGTGDKAIDRIIWHMSRLAKRDAQAQQITRLARTLKGTDEFDTIKRIFFFIADLFRYKADPPGFEYVRAPIHSLLLREGDCDCMTTALAAVLMAAGFEVAFVVIAWDKERCTSFGCPFTHVYLLVRTKQYGWIPLDPVMKRDGLGREKAPIIRRKRYIVKLVTLEDNLKNSRSTGGTCRKRKVPVRLNIVNNIVAGNGNGNSQVHVRNNSPDAYSTSEQRHHGYYSDNSERNEYQRNEYRSNSPPARERPRTRPQRPIPEEPSPMPQVPRPSQAHDTQDKPVAPPPVPPPPAQPEPAPPEPEKREEPLPIYRRPRREFM